VLVVVPVVLLQVILDWCQRPTQNLLLDLVHQINLQLLSVLEVVANRVLMLQVVLVLIPRLLVLDHGV
tara:strand:+ start:49 stop:252 length:204 start_codon:yes stop_codon:yes gene_type:complete